MNEHFGKIKFAKYLFLKKFIQEIKTPEKTAIKSSVHCTSFKVSNLFLYCFCKGLKFIKNSIHFRHFGVLGDQNTNTRNK